MKLKDFILCKVLGEHKYPKNEIPNLFKTKCVKCGISLNDGEHLF